MKKLILGITLTSVLFLTGCLGGSKLICTSKEGNITINYSDSAITGYSASGITYEMDEQNEVVDAMGMDQYITDFTTWFETNTTGTCTKEESE